MAPSADCDEAYMQGVTPAGPGLCLPLGPGLNTAGSGWAWWMGQPRWSHVGRTSLTQSKATCLLMTLCWIAHNLRGVLESGNHVLLHCPRTETAWDQARTLASAAVVGT